MTYAKGPKKYGFLPNYFHQSSNWARCSFCSLFTITEFAKLVEFFAKPPFCSFFLSSPLKVSQNFIEQSVWKKEKIYHRSHFGFLGQRVYWKEMFRNKDSPGSILSSTQKFTASKLGIDGHIFLYGITPPQSCLGNIWVWSVPRKAQYSFKFFFVKA